MVNTVLQEAVMIQQKTAIVIAGATGDLAQRKLIPALSLLFTQNKLGTDPVIIGIGRNDLTDEVFRSRFKLSAEFASYLRYHRHIAGIRSFIEAIGTFDRIIFFLSLPPETYEKTAQDIADEGFGKKASLIIEKPFGRSEASARALNNALSKNFDESQLFRIDHYLGKEAVQNILVFRFANPLFCPVWNSTCIESIQINALESDGIIERGAYFDTSGIIRDMVQNHLLQLLCLLTMEPPVTLNPDDIRNQKIAVLRSLRVEEAYRYQYNGYHVSTGVAPGSSTETFAELKLSINNLRWAGVPVYIRTGKSADRKGTEIGIRFKKMPRLLYNTDGELAPNQIVFKIQPAEGIIIDIQSKVPGSDSSITRSKMNFCYNASFRQAIPEAYQRLLHDVIRNDHTLFVSAEESETAWRVVEPVLDKGSVTIYPQGSIPKSQLSCDWMNFEEYQNLCL